MMRRSSFAITLCVLAAYSSSPPSRAQGLASVPVENAPQPTAGAVYEIVPDSEPGDIVVIRRLTIELMHSVAKGGKPTERDQHPKAHGFVRANFTVLDAIPGELKVGLFREPRTYPAVIRFSSTGRQNDIEPDNHGMAIKLMGVEGEKLLEQEEGAETQDFILFDHPLFFTASVARLAAFSRDRAEMARKGFIGEDALDAMRERWPLEIALLKGRRQRIASPLAVQYFSSTPYRLGATAVKYCARPEGHQEAAGKAPDGENGLRAAMVEHLTTRRQPAAFGFYVQRRREGESIEDSTVAWESAWERVATIEISPQQFDFPEREKWGNALSYTPWHALPEHRPLGGINRARKVIYTATSVLRHEGLGVPPREPTEADIPMRAPARN